MGWRTIRAGGRREEEGKWGRRTESEQGRKEGEGGRKVTREGMRREIWGRKYRYSRKE